MTKKNLQPISEESPEEEVKLYQNFAITVTLRPDLAVGSVSRQLYNTYPEIQRIIKRYIQCDKYHIYPEFNKNLGLHYHGILYMAKISDVIRRKHLFTNNLGYSLIKPLENYKKWFDYCTKDLNISNVVFNHLSFPLNQETKLKIVWNKELNLDLIDEYDETDYEEEKDAYPDVAKPPGEGGAAGI